MKKLELLLPAGNIECLRAAVANGADAVYLGMSKFNARISAGNFNEKNISSIIQFCHKKKVKVYVAFNVIVKNDEIQEYLEQISIAYNSGADAIIIQDPCLVPLIEKNFPELSIHLSTQATITNVQGIPDGVNRLVLPRELALDEITKISKKHETEIFVHGALCFSYSGQCLFSSIVGGRSGNRGRCAQPCRKRYNNKYLLSTKDLSLVENIPEIIKAGVTSLKVEGRLRSPLYVGTVAKIYRKYINKFFAGKFKINENDIKDLKIVFNREFTSGFGFTNSIVDNRMPMNRGLYIGNINDGILELKEDLKIGDGIGIWTREKVQGFKIKEINGATKTGKAGFQVTIGYEKKGNYPVYKTSSVDIKLRLGDKIKIKESVLEKKEIVIENIDSIDNTDKVKIFAKAYNKKSAMALDKEKTDVIYYDILKSDCEEVKKEIKNSKFFVFTPRIVSSGQIKEILKQIEKIIPDGVLVGNRGFLKSLQNYEVHLDYSFNVINDYDINCYQGLPIVSLEMSLDGIKKLQNKKVITMIHGDMVLMTTKEPLKSPELIDDEGRHFKVRQAFDSLEILNSKQLGLFNKAKEYLDVGIKYFYIDVSKDAEKFVWIYRKILSGKKFDDQKIRKGYTTGYFDKELV